MTDQEIIKASECCIKAKTRGDCMRLKCPACVPEGCAYYNRSETDCEDGVYVEIEKDLLAIITRQQAEIERLKATLDCYEETSGNKKAKAEAVREFAEKLKATPLRFRVDHIRLIDEPPESKMVLFVDDSDIDNLIEEMAGDSNGE